MVPTIVAGERAARSAQHAGHVRWPQATAGVLIHPRFRRLPPPVIVIGVHRSGTSVVTAILAALGLHMGGELRRFSERGPEDAGRLEPYVGNAEPSDFRLLNDRLLARAGSTWNRVDEFLDRRDDVAFAPPAVRLLQGATFGSLRRGFLGSLPSSFHGAWGWKDPRNSLTLPYWLRLFPSARIIHVRRDPAAVTASLHRRAHEWRETPLSKPPLRERLLAALDNPAAALRYVERRLGLPTDPPRPDPCLDRGHCERLAETYLEQCLLNRERGAAFLEVSHEELQHLPLSVTSRLARFSGAAADADRIAWAADLVRPISSF